MAGRTIEGRPAGRRHPTLRCMTPRLDPRPASRFHAVKPRNVKVITKGHHRVSGVTWDLPADLRYTDQHENELGSWGTVDAESLRVSLHVAGDDDQRVQLDPEHVLRLIVRL